MKVSNPIFSKINPAVKFLPVLFVFTMGMSCFGYGTMAETTTTVGTMETLQGGSSRPGSYGHSGYNNPQSSGGTKTLDQLYAEMAEHINSGKALSDEQVAGYVSAMRTLHRTAAGMPREMQDKYNLIAAWLLYFRGDTKNAGKKAKEVMIKSPENKDGYATHTALSLLEGEEPVSPRAVKSRARQNRQVPPMLELDIDQIRNDVIGVSVSDLNFKCLNSTSFSYDAGEENLCVVLWRLSGNESNAGSSEPNGIGSTEQPVETRPEPIGYNGYEEYNEYGPGMMGMPAYGQKRKQQPPFQASMDAFKDIFSAVYGAENIKFLAVNKDNADDKRAVVDKLLENPWPWAHVMENDPKSGAVQFKGIEVKHDHPVMLLISQGTISYAGPATGFLAPMMAAKAAGTTGDSAIPVKKKGSAMSMLKNVMSMADTDKTDSETRIQVQDNQPEAEPVELTIVEDIAAQRLLGNCKREINFGRKLGSYKKGVDYCKEAIREYPGTKYAEEARMLLRKVPERHHKKYDITDEDLGL